MRVLYIGTNKMNYSVDGVYIKGLRKNSVEVFDYSLYGMKGLNLHIEAIKLCFKHFKDVDYVFVGYDSPKIIISIWPFCRKKIIYNALCSVYERLIVSRGLAQAKSVKGYYYWLLDFLACRFSSLVMLESEHQIQYFQKLFKLPREKFYLARIGVDDEVFFPKHGIEKFKEFTVLFRGRLLPEAGGEYAVKAAKTLELYPIQFLMIANGMELLKVQSLVSELKPKNLKLITEFLPDDELLMTMQKCHVSLGQLSNHERLERTIPHKAYESLSLRLPYLTARNPGVMELLKENETCLAFAPSDENDLAKKILWAKEHPQELERVAQNGYELFKNHLTCQKLGEKLLNQLLNQIIEPT